MVDNNGVCKLADFGSAKRICGIYENERNHSLSGTANWMAPEVIRQTGSGRFIFQVICHFLLKMSNFLLGLQIFGVLDAQ